MGVTVTVVICVTVTVEGCKDMVVVNVVWALPAAPEPDVACISTIPTTEAEITITTTIVAAAMLIPDLARPNRRDCPSKVAKPSPKKDNYCEFRI